MRASVYKQASAKQDGTGDQVKFWISWPADPFPLYPDIFLPHLG